MIGRLDGFMFAPDASAAGSEAKALNAAAQKALASEIEARATKLSQASNDQIVLANDGAVRWQGDVVGKLVAGDEVLRPRAAHRRRRSSDRPGARTGADPARPLAQDLHREAARAAVRALRRRGHHRHGARRRLPARRGAWRARASARLGRSQRARPAGARDACANTACASAPITFICRCCSSPRRARWRRSFGRSSMKPHMQRASTICCISPPAAAPRFRSTTRRRSRSIAPPVIASPASARCASTFLSGSPISFVPALSWREGTTAEAGRRVRWPQLHRHRRDDLADRRVGRRLRLDPALARLSHGSQAQAAGGGSRNKAGGNETAPPSSAGRTTDGSNRRQRDIAGAATEPAPAAAADAPVAAASCRDVAPVRVASSRSLLPAHRFLPGAFAPVVPRRPPRSTAEQPVEEPPARRRSRHCAGRRRSDRVPKRSPARSGGRNRAVCIEVLASGRIVVERPPAAADRKPQHAAPRAPAAQCRAEPPRDRAADQAAQPARRHICRTEAPTSSRSRGPRRERRRETRRRSRAASDRAAASRAAERESATSATMRDRPPRRDRGAPVDRAEREQYYAKPGQGIRHKQGSGSEFALRQACRAQAAARRRRQAAQQVACASATTPAHRQMAVACAHGAHPQRCGGAGRRPAMSASMARGCWRRAICCGAVTS